MQRHPRGIDSLSPAQFAGLTLAVSFLAFTCGGIVEAATLALAPRAALPAALEPLPPGALRSADRAVDEAPAAADQIPAGANQAPACANQSPPGVNRTPSCGQFAVAEADAERAQGPANPAAGTDTRVTDGATAPQPDASGGTSVAVIDGSAPLRRASVEVIDGSATSIALGTVAPRTQWGIASTVDVIDGSAPHVRPRTDN